MKINNLYEYKKIDRVTTETERNYLVNNSPVPSVTTILSKTKDMTVLNNWKKRVGAEKAEEIRNTAAGIGTHLHSNLEKFILEGVAPQGNLLVKTMSNLIINKGLKNVNEVWGVEIGLHFDDLYAGTADVIAVHNGIPCIIDFKNSLRNKKEEWIGDYRCQLAAYALAHDRMFGTKINKGVIMLATRDLNYQEFVFEGAEFDKGCYEWCDRLEQYYS